MHEGTDPQFDRPDTHVFRILVQAPAAAIANEQPQPVRPRTPSRGPMPSAHWGGVSFDGKVPPPVDPTLGERLQTLFPEASTATPGCPVFRYRATRP